MRLLSGPCLPATEHLATLALNMVFKEERRKQTKTFRVCQPGFPKSTAARGFRESFLRSDSEGHSDLGSQLSSCGKACSPGPSFQISHNIFFQTVLETQCILTALASSGKAVETGFPVYTFH